MLVLNHVFFFFQTAGLAAFRCLGAGRNAESDEFDSDFFTEDEQEGGDAEQQALEAQSKVMRALGMPWKQLAPQSQSLFSLLPCCAESFTNRIPCAFAFVLHNGVVACQAPKRKAKAKKNVYVDPLTAALNKAKKGAKLFQHKCFAL